jgi:hypothetical protein
MALGLEGLVLRQLLEPSRVLLAQRWGTQSEVQADKQ